MLAVGTGYCEVVDSSCPTIFCAAARPEPAVLLLLLLLAVAELAGLEFELELLPELHAASSAAAVIAAPGASHCFHLCVIAM
jgi:hypothetical protein